MNTWTMHVEDFGKIKNADIEIAPMTLFVGDNNSGKSYIMTLIYGLLNANLFGDPYQFPKDSENFAECQKLFNKLVEKDNYADQSLVNTKMNEDEIEIFEKMINEILSLNKDIFVKNLFNKKIDIGNIKIRFKKDNKYILRSDLVYTLSPPGFVYLSCLNEEGKQGVFGAMSLDEIYREHVYMVFLEMVTKYMLTGNSENCIYFPTARTGYVLTYKSLIGSAIKHKFNLDSMPKNLLTRPNSDFLMKLSELTGNDMMRDEAERNNHIQSAIDIIENNIVKGHVTISDMPVQDIVYHPNDTDVNLPMFVTSGVVTEMTPLLLFLKNSPPQTILIEEPEISLHPQLQCEIARVLIRLVNAGISVFVTTHSDIILQQINNMIKLARASDRDTVCKKLGYEECDWIDQEKINVYQFDADDSHGTVVRKLSCGDYGFEAMTFYDTMEALNRQTMMIEES